MLYHARHHRGGHPGPRRWRRPDHRHRYSQTDIHVLCRATALDAAGHVIPNASVQTLAEAGRLDWLRDSGGVQEFVYTVRPSTFRHRLGHAA